MSRFDNRKSWIFVSHSSDDLVQVRQVRNYLEKKGASPLLFHLLSLENPEQFWPIIEKEIASRNFFLYCDSQSAATSEWVQKERALVQSFAKKKPVRIGQINVEQTEIDQKGLDSFLEKTRVFLSYSQHDRANIETFIPTLEESGFQIFSDFDLATGEDHCIRIAHELKLAASFGWVVIFLSNSSRKSLFVRDEINEAHSLGATVVYVMIDNPHIPLGLPTAKTLDAINEPLTAPKRLAELLLSLPV